MGKRDLSDMETTGQENRGARDKGIREQGTRVPRDQSTTRQRGNRIKGEE